MDAATQHIRMSILCLAVGALFKSHPNPAALRESFTELLSNLVSAEAAGLSEILPSHVKKAQDDLIALLLGSIS